jgi:Fe-S-cluster containining protein
MHPTADEPWYRDGLRFECTRCGNCCTGAPGFVWVNTEEIAALARLLNEPVAAVKALYTRVASRGRTLREKANGDCIFFEQGKGCTVYAERPRQCRTWPFWESGTRDPEAWEALKKGCPGAGTGPLIPVEEIQRRIKVIKL